MDKRKVILALAALLLLISLAGELLTALFFEDYTGRAHLAVPVFFLALYAIPVAIMAQPKDAKQFIKQFMIFKSLKFVFSLCAMLAMCFIFKAQVVGVLSSFLIYSLVLIVVENLYVLKLKNKF